MIYLVDANILSEPTKPNPHPRVVERLKRHERDLAVDPIILGEIRFGILLLPPGARRRKLEKWLVLGIEKIRCLPFDAATGTRWAKLLADLRTARHAMPVKDSLIAATALTHNLTLATHNTPHFAHTGLNLTDPFAE